MFFKNEKEKCFAYLAHTACDNNNFILDFHITSGNIHDSVAFSDLYQKIKNNSKQHLSLIHILLHNKYKSKEGFILETIGYRISKARRYMNMNQKELALKANIPEGSLSRYENDIREPKAQALVQIADALKVSTDYLLGLTDEMEIQNNSLADKSDEEFEAIYEAAKEKFTTGTVMFDGEPATQEAIDSMLQAMRMGMLLALEEQKKKRDKNK